MLTLRLGPESLPFEFNVVEYDDIAILFSGGTDSTLLLYLLLTENKFLKKKITSYIIDRYNKPLEKAIKVNKMLFSRFNLTNELKLLSLPNLPQNLEVITGLNILSKTHSIIMTGINKYPSDESIRPKYEAESLRDTIKDNIKFKFPFKYLEKYHIIDAFYKLGIQEFLPYTHSCGSANILPCSECFNCRERIWAYKKLNLKPDLGI